MTKDEIIEAILSFPVGERVQIVEAILETLNTPDPEVEKAWIEEAEQRLDEIESGKVEPVPGKQAMDELRKIAEE